MAVNLSSTINKHYESFSGVYNDRVKNIIIMLGWAAANNVPFHEALQNSSKFGNKFDQAIAALKNGSTLSEALKHAKQSLPKHYLKAVEIAEQNNRLPEV